MALGSYSDWTSLSHHRYRCWKILKHCNHVHVHIITHLHGTAMEAPTVLRLISMAAVLSVACAGRDTVPTNRIPPEPQRVHEKVVGPDSFDVKEGVRYLCYHPIRG